MPSTGTAGSTYSGAANIINQVSTLRPNAVDTLKIFERKYGDVEFMNALFHKKIPKRAVNDYKFIRGEREEDVVKITITTSGTNIGGTQMSFVISTQQANLLDVGMMLQNHNVDYDGITDGTYEIPAAGISDVRKPEIAEIISIAPLTATTSTITVRRGHTIYGGAGTHSDTVLWLTTHNVFRGNFIAHDSESYHVPNDTNPDLFYNYIGDFRMPVGMTERKRNVKQWAGDDGSMAALNARKFDTLMKDMERAFLFQSYALDTTQTGRERTGSRSVLEVIPSDNWLSVDAATIQALDNQLIFFTEKGKSSDLRILVGTSSFIVKFAHLFTDHITEEPLYGDKNLGWTVPTYRDKLGGRYQLLHSYEMGRSDMFDDRAFVINMSAVNYAYFVGAEGSFDLYLDKGKDGKGLQGNGSKDLIYEYRACVGLDIMAWDYHGMLTLNF